MIINCSRTKTALLCWRKAFNNYHRCVEGARSMNLVDGGAFHEAVANGLATPADKDWDHALAVAKEKFDQEAATSTIPAEQQFLLQQHWNSVVKMVELYKENYGNENYTIVQPECSFDVVLPNTHHHCVLVHHLEYELPDFRGMFIERWGMPSAQAIMQRRVSLAHDPLDPDKDCPCWQPHRLVGKTDALVKWKGNLWLLEHKTTALSGDQFWDQWDIDLQPTTYIYGMWKSMNIKPSGFVLDAIYKPSEAQIANWNSRRKYGPPKQLADYMGYERRAFLRTDEDLARVEKQYSQLCDEWEVKILQGYFPMSNVAGACKQYNRRCDYWMACIKHDEQSEFDSLAPRRLDYVNEKLVQLLPVNVERGEPK